MRSTRPRRGPWLGRRAILWLWLTTVLLIGVLIGIGIAYAAKAWACDPGQYYDPEHSICQGSAPAYPRGGYGPWQNNYPGFPSNAPKGGWGQ